MENTSFTLVLYSDFTVIFFQVSTLKYANSINVGKFLISSTHTSGAHAEITLSAFMALCKAEPFFPLFLLSL